MIERREDDVRPLLSDQPDKAGNRRAHFHVLQIDDRHVRRQAEDRITTVDDHQPWTEPAPIEVFDQQADDSLSAAASHVWDQEQNVGPGDRRLDGALRPGRLDALIDLQTHDPAPPRRAYTLPFLARGSRASSRARCARAPRWPQAKLASNIV